jgi:ankyrin repeat protein
MYAARDGYADIVDLLLARGAEPNARNKSGATPLIVAALNNQAQIVQRLIVAGARIDDQNHQGWTALMYAAWKGHRDMVQLLLENGANPSVRDKEEKTALMYAEWQRSTPRSYSPEQQEQLKVASSADYRAIEELLRHADLPLHSRK